MAATGDLTRNGNPVLDSRTTGAYPRLRKIALPVKSGERRHFVLRDGAMGFLLVHFALWWHETIAPLNVGPWDEWGYAPRPPRGSSSGFSEHAAGAAVDLNATLHPMGVPAARNLKPWQVAAILARLALYAGALRWGGKWKRPDAMHAEVVGGLRLCERVARRLVKSPRGKRILDANPGLLDVILS